MERKITFFVKTRNIKRPQVIEGYINNDDGTIETKGFFTYADKDEKIHIIPVENIEYFTIGYSLVEYANMNGYSDGSQSPDSLTLANYALDTSREKLIQITGAFAVAKGEKYIAFDTFGKEMVNRIFVPISTVNDIEIEPVEDINEYKASLLFDKRIIKVAAGDDNTDRVMDIFKNLAKANITEGEIIQLYRADFYDLSLLPEDLARGLEVYVNGTEEVIEEDIIEPEYINKPEEAIEEEAIQEELPIVDGTIVEYPVANEEEANQEQSVDEVPVVNEEQQLGAVLANQHKDLYDLAQLEFDNDVKRYKNFGKYRLFTELANDKLIRENNPAFSSTLLDLEESYFEVVKEFEPQLDISSDIFKEALYEYIQQL
mgnify:CR=1 FL=1